MNELKKRACEPCREGSAPLSAIETERLMKQLQGWNIVMEDGVNRLQRTFTFPDFRQALAFTNRVGELAEAENHHPKLITEWGRVTVAWWTHSVNGLHLNDFIMAARTG
ncbi:MAG: 4a-hydroxytetrahydrobiopterin dehydratase [Chlorobium sp.]|uniref:4a-hydroxytetrahydrobiopterin dehydratase n=1 Tax=Chlorobium sp. TaxID=1095 RepID=UPI0025C70B89|nr:4a-hydroxytetrahydrobiopterin dehydratase [Chlorobium sp.]MCF8382404.1 4a-hydroxytetrahydrobiopterin dehydratase [Chlorobium sp.]